MAMYNLINVLKLRFQKGMEKKSDHYFKILFDAVNLVCQLC